MGSFNHGFALVVGIANYTNVPRLPAAVLNDAADLAAVLRDPQRCGYPPQQVRHLSDSEATAERIREELDWLAYSTNEESTALLFFSGHGWREDDKGEHRNYLLAADALIETDRREGVIDDATLTGCLRAIEAGRLLVLFDCCHAAGAGELKSGSLRRDSFKAGFDESYYARLGTGQGRALFASSRSDEESLVFRDMGNSLFTNYVLEALRGEASGPDGEVGVLDVFRFVSEKVPEHDPRQHPVFKAEIENNFAIALGSIREAEVEREATSSGSRSAFNIGKQDAKNIVNAETIQGSSFNFS